MVAATAQRIEEEGLLILQKVKMAMRSEGVLSIYIVPRGHQCLPHQDREWVSSFCGQLSSLPVIQTLEAGVILALQLHKHCPNFTLTARSAHRVASRQQLIQHEDVLGMFPEWYGEY